MTDEKRGRQRTRKILLLALATLLVIAAALIVPPLVSVSRYKGQITHLISTSLGRPVRLASVEARLLPRPGFVLTDLTVDEDPEYGAEPVLHANTVVASIRLLSLWRGKLEIGTISVDEASVNLVHTTQGRWNVEPLFRTAAQSNLNQPVPLRLPYLEATNSRINLKNGAEKLPFSLVNTDLSFWQDRPGDWRIRLRGQPARTDLSLDLADTGIVRLEGSVRHAAELRQMPLHVDMVWREAQLGQLTLLVVGSDPGWRGALTGELHLDGTAESAQVKTRLRAESVHRAEFAPPVPMDFDANCSFAYRFLNRSLENLACDSPLGNGRVHLAGELPGNGVPKLSVDLDRVPVQAGLDALRTVRSGFAPGLEAGGAISGSMTYAAVPPQAADLANQPGHAKNRSKMPPPVQSPLSGSFTIDGLQLSGDGLSSPVQISRVVVAPMPIPQDRPQALTATLAIPAGGSAPLAVNARLARSGYQISIHGQAAIARARELAHVAGVSDAAALENLAGDPLSMDLSAEGPWVPSPRMAFAAAPLPGAVPSASTATDAPVSDRLSGTVMLHKASWKADYLVNPVEIAQATLHLGGGPLRWDPVEFAYGPVKGTANLTLPAPCALPQPCPAGALPTFNVQLGELEASAIQSAFLGARQKGTLLSTLLARLRPAPSTAWPQFEGTVKAASLALGRVKLQNATATLRTSEDGAEISNFDAGLLGGTIHGSGTYLAAKTSQGKPGYALSGQFQKLNPSAVGQLLGLHWTGGSFDGSGKLNLTGFTDRDLASSAKGTLHFDWRRGKTSGAASTTLPRFEHWSASAEIANGAITLKDNQMQQGAQMVAVEGTVTFAEPPKVTLVAPHETKARKASRSR